MRANGDLTLFSTPMALKTIIDGWSFETDRGSSDVAEVRLQVSCYKHYSEARLLREKNSLMIIWV